MGLNPGKLHGTQEWRLGSDDMFPLQMANFGFHANF